VFPLGAGGIFERRGREGFAEDAKEDKEKNSQNELKYDLFIL
jgi:hypothetical protein